MRIFWPTITRKHSGAQNDASGATKARSNRRAMDANNLLALAADNPPDLVLVDWELPGRSIEDLITELHTRQPKPVVVVMGSRPEYGRMLLKAGADAFSAKATNRIGCWISCTNLEAVQ